MCNSILFVSCLLQRIGAIQEQQKMRNYLRRIERDGVQRVKMFLVITAAYIIFWGPLFFVTLVQHPAIRNPTGHEVFALSLLVNEKCKDKIWGFIMGLEKKFKNF